MKHRWSKARCYWGVMSSEGWVYFATSRRAFKLAHHLAKNPELYEPVCVKKIVSIGRFYRSRHRRYEYFIYPDQSKRVHLPWNR